MENERTVIRDIKFNRGDTYVFGFTVIGLNEELDTVYVTCRKEKKRESEMLFQVKLNEGITYLGEGKYQVRIAPEKTQNMPASRYYYDLELGHNGDILTPLKGKLILDWDITRR